MPSGRDTLAPGRPGMRSRATGRPGCLLGGRLSADRDPLAFDKLAKDRLFDWGYVSEPEARLGGGAWLPRVRSAPVHNVPRVEANAVRTLLQPDRLEGRLWWIKLSHHVDDLLAVLLADLEQRLRQAFLPGDALGGAPLLLAETGRLDAGRGELLRFLLSKGIIDRRRVFLDL